MLEQYLPDHNESVSVVLERFGAIGIDTPGVVALLGNSFFSFFSLQSELNQSD